MEKEQQNKQPKNNTEQGFKSAINTLSDVTKYTGIILVVFGGIILAVKLGKVLVKDVKEIGL
jgi:hypothetical protein